LREPQWLLPETPRRSNEKFGDGTKNTDVHLYVYNEAGKEVGKDDSPGPKCSARVGSKT